MKSKYLLLAVIFFILIATAMKVFPEEKDSDLDGLPDPQDSFPFDYDNDGMPDLWEKKYGLSYDKNDAYHDPDGDGMKNVDEYKQGTDPLLSEKTNQRAVVELLSPIERTLVRLLVWGATIFFVFIVGAFIYYRTHLFNIFKFIHHISREHFEQHQGQYAVPPYKMQAAPVNAARQAMAPQPAPVQQARPTVAQKQVVKPAVASVKRAVAQQPVVKPAVASVKQVVAQPFKPQPVKPAVIMTRPKSPETQHTDDVFQRLSRYTNTGKI